MPRPPRRTIDSRRALAHLSASDPVMARLIRATGPFRLRADRGTPFESLSRAVIYQQISGAAAGTIYSRFLALFGRGGIDPRVSRTSPAWKPQAGAFPAPEEVLKVRADRLRAAGLSRQKVLYLRDLAAHFGAGRISAAAMSGWTDDEIIDHLTAIKGIGRWTAEMFLIFHLRRPDVLPRNDVGINRSLRIHYGIREPIRPADVEKVGAAWRPWATVAAWYLWRSSRVETRLVRPKRSR